ncbi:MAG: hypothetical protein JWM82_1835 [Myxococcales bacterium]|nr:hypothetical protein [Myxococcales bacterium]
MKGICASRLLPIAIVAPRDTRGILDRYWERLTRRAGDDDGCPRWTRLVPRAGSSVSEEPEVETFELESRVGDVDGHPGTDAVVAQNDQKSSGHDDTKCRAPEVRGWTAGIPGLLAKQAEGRVRDDGVEARRRQRKQVILRASE